MARFVGVNTFWDVKQFGPLELPWEEGGAAASEVAGTARVGLIRIDPGRSVLLRVL